MSKFNLKSYQKINGNQHIDSRLREHHSDAPNKINEKQLDTYRGKESNFLTEEQLERSRSASKTKEATEITERRLNNAEEEFGVKQRNASAYEGDLNKLEEQRLKGSPVEEEKYEESSSTPKGMRWWEQGGESPDGLKLAQKKTVTRKTAQSEELTFDKPRFEDTFEEDMSPVEIDEDDKSEEEDAINPVDSVKKEYDIEDITDADNLPDFEIEDNSLDSNEGVMYITKQKDLNGDIPAVYMVLEYSVEDFGRDELAIKQKALNRVLEERPELKGIIDVSDFGNIRESEDGIGQVSLRSVDERLSGVLADKPEKFTEEPSVDMTPGFEEVSYDVQDIGGTPMASGEISFNLDPNESNRQTIIDGALDFIEDSYGMEVTEDSLDLSGLEEGSIRFLIEAPSEGIGINASADFPVIEVTSQVLKKK